MLTTYYNNNRRMTEILLCIVGGWSLVFQVPKHCRKVAVKHRRCNEFTTIHFRAVRSVVYYMSLVLLTPCHFWSDMVFCIVSVLYRVNWFYLFIDIAMAIIITYYVITINEKYYYRGYQYESVLMRFEDGSIQ